MHAHVVPSHAGAVLIPAHMQRHWLTAANMEYASPYLRNRLFANSRPDLIDDFKLQLTPHTYAKKGVVFDEGDPPMFVYLVDRGAVRIRRNSRDGNLVTSAIIGQADFFGAEAVMGDLVRTSSATCIEPSHIRAIRVHDVQHLMSRDPVIALNVAMRFKEQRDDALDVLEDIASLSVGDRLLQLFKRLARTHGTSLCGETLIDIRLTQADIASFIGSTRETVSIEIKNLVDSNLIRFQGRKVVLCGHPPTRRPPPREFVGSWPYCDFAARSATSQL